MCVCVCVCVCVFSCNILCKLFLMGLCSTCVYNIIFSLICYVSAQGVDERAINVHCCYYYYYMCTWGSEHAMFCVDILMSNVSLTHSCLYVYK